MYPSVIHPCLTPAVFAWKVEVHPWQIPTPSQVLINTHQDTCFCQLVLQVSPSSSTLLSKYGRFWPHKRLTADNNRWTGDRKILASILYFIKIKNHDAWWEMKAPEFGQFGDLKSPYASFSCVKLSWGAEKPCHVYTLIMCNRCLFSISASHSASEFVCRFRHFTPITVD